MNSPIDSWAAQHMASSAKWVLLGLFGLMAAWETLAPRRHLQLSTTRRWIQHFLLYLISAESFRLIFGIGTVALAASVADSPYGLLNRASIPYAARFTLTILIIDLVRYLQHRVLHAVSWLWRLHLLHHSDRDYDFTVEFRFHPLESILTRGSALIAVALLAPPPFAVAASEILALICGMLAHGNVRFPLALERLLRYIVITPELHRIHHSLDELEQRQNVGTVFVWWDRLFGTYREAPTLGQEAMQFGVRQVGASECIRPFHMLGAPFRR